MVSKAYELLLVVKVW